MKKIFSIMMILCLCFCMFPIGNTQAATIKLNKKNLKLTVGKTYKLKVKNLKKKVRWSSSKKSVATVNTKGVVKAKKAGKTIVTAKIQSKKLKCKVLVKAKSKTNKTTQSEEEIKYGSLEGNITFHFNRYRGYVSDTGAKVFVINKKENVVVGKGTVDGTGNYKISHIPVGQYNILISSHECKSETVLYGNERENLEKQYNIFMNVAGTIYWQYNVDIYENETAQVSYAFPYSDF